MQSFLAKRANEMRQRPTPAECALKKRLEQEGIRHQFQSIKFSKGTYRIFDFYLPKYRVVIEVDGGYHDPDYDAHRDRMVKAAHQRYDILRFSNDEIINDLERCMIELKEKLGGAYS